MYIGPVSILRCAGMAMHFACQHISGRLSGDGRAHAAPAQKHDTSLIARPVRLVRPWAASPEPLAPYEVWTIEGIILMSMNQGPVEVHWRDEKLRITELFQRDQTTAALISADRPSIHVHCSSCDARCERDDQVMCAWLLEILILRLCPPAEARPLPERFTKNGSPFRLGIALRGFFEKAPLDA